MAEKKPTIQDSVRILLGEIGEDPNREGLIGTPDRVEKMYHEICSGYQQDLDQIVNRAVFREKTDGMVIVRDIVFYSLCEHHLLPFFGKVHVAYLPKEQIIGLSKIPRIVEMFAKRLQVQERLTVLIKEALEDVLSPHGTAVLIEAKHLCAMMRGVKKEQAKLVTTSFSGVFTQEERYRLEFLNMICKKGKKSQKARE